MGFTNGLYAGYPAGYCGSLYAGYPRYGVYDGYIARYPRYRVGYDNTFIYVPDNAGYVTYDDDDATINAIDRASLELLEEERRDIERRLAELEADLQRQRLEEDDDGDVDLAAPTLDAEPLDAGPILDLDTPADDDAWESERTKIVGETLSRGDNFFERGDYASARDDYVRALVLAGDDASVRIAIGLADYALGSYGDASRAIRWGAAYSPALAQSGFDLEKAYGTAEDARTHLEALKKHVESHPEDSDARFLLGFVRYFSSRRSEGVADMKAYLATPDHDARIQLFVDMAERKIGDDAAR